MGDNLKLPERNCARTPMQWSTEPNAGFTKSDKPVMPVISAGPYGFEHVNVAAQRRDPNSLMNWMERIIRMRKETPEIGWGDFSFISAQATDILIMRYEWRDNSVIIVHNFSPFPREVSFSVGTGPKQACSLINLLSDDHSQPIDGNRHRILLEPYGYRWYRVCGLDYLLIRSPA
jgi:maltose alpha-D-glucosyltransferase / alpha-amylase